jgi:2-hydroxy-3-keto-5-methylthiopentenyl-1-phosphate phosphatase
MAVDKNTNFEIKIFCDFDGTVTSKDLGDEIFKRFGEFDELRKLTSKLIGIASLKLWTISSIRQSLPNLPKNLKLTHIL